MHPDAPYFSILFCLTPDDFTREMESAATQWDNCICNQLTRHRFSGEGCVRPPPPPRNDLAPPSKVFTPPQIIYILI